jgi:hypothetical protein
MNYRNYCWIINSRALLALVPFLGVGQSLAATPAASFDHSTNADTMQSVSADANDTITITINNTCADQFNYADPGSLGTAKSAPAPAGPAPAPAAAAALAPAAPPASCSSAMYGDTTLQAKFDAALSAKQVCKEASTDLFIKYDNKFGGYNIVIVPKDGKGVIGADGKSVVSAISSGNYTSAFQAYKKAYANAYAADHSSKSCDAIADDTAASVVSDSSATTISQLKPVIETVAITTATPAIELAGAFTVSKLTDHKYMLAPAPGGGTGQVIAENKSAEDSEKLGVAGFIHVHNANCSGSAAWDWMCSHVAATLGLGITNNSNLSIFLGPSYRFAGQWFLTAGYNWGSIATLPASDRVGQAPSSPSILSNLATRTAGAFFLGVSYAFLNPGNSFFQKPFSSSPQSATSPQAGK